MIFGLNSYFLPTKSGNNFYLIAVYLILVFALRFFRLDKLPQRFLWRFSAIIFLIFLPVAVLYVSNKIFITYVFFGWILCLSVYSSTWPTKTWILLLASLISVSIYNLSGAFIPIVLLISLLFIYVPDAYALRKSGLSIYICLALTISWFFYQFIFYRDQIKYENRIDTQENIRGVDYTIVKQKNDRHVFENGTFIFSTADYFMYYESMVHSAFQILPEARPVLLASKDEIFLYHELKKYDDLDIYSINRPFSLSTLVAGLLPFEPVPQRTILKDKKFDIIFIDKNEPDDDYFGLLTAQGIMVTKENAFPNYWTSSHTFHVALPTSGEIKWTVVSKDSTAFENISMMSKKIKTKWYTNGAYQLISNSGKY